MAMTKAEKAVVDALRLTLALRWPTEGKPTRLFAFGDYDRAYGEPVEGDYHVAHGTSVEPVALRKATTGWKTWTFNGSASVKRGNYYLTEREARLEVLWAECTAAALTLERAWAAFDRAVTASATGAT